MKTFIKKLYISFAVLAGLLMPFSLAKAQTVTLPPVYTIGDIIYASATKVLSKLGIGSNGQCLKVSGGLPAWGSCSSISSTTDLSEGTNLYFTDERAQDAVGGILTDTTSIDVTYSDGTPSITASITDGDKGDITTSSTGNTWTIDNDSVSFAKMQNITTNRLLGRSTASTGDIEQISIGSGLSLSAGVLSNTFAGAVGGAGEIQFSDGVGNFDSDAGLTFNDGTGTLSTSVLNATNYEVISEIAFLTGGTLLTEPSAGLLSIDGKTILTENNTVTVTNKTIDSDTNTLSVDPDELKSVDSPADEECYTYESTGTTGEWQTCGGGGSGDITGVGDVSSGEAFNGTQGTLLTFNDADGDATLEYDNTNNWFEFLGSVNPKINDGGTLGNATQSWSDLFLASGGVIDFNANDITLTHSANVLTLAGGTLVLPASGLQIGSSNPFSDSSGTLTLQNIDAIDGTTETTLEGALDIAGDVTGTGLGAVTVVSASDTTAGKVELATTAETNTGTDTARAVTPDGLAGSYAGIKNLDFYIIDWSYNLTTGDGKAYTRIPSEYNGMNVVGARCSVGTTSSSGTPTFQLARGRQANATSAHSFVDVLSTRITIDSTEYDSKDASASAVINTSNDDMATGDLLRWDVDVTGTGTKGLMCNVALQLP